MLCRHANAQDFAADNHRIDSLINAGLPKSALNEVAKSELRARNLKNDPQQIQTAIYRMLLQSYVTDNAMVGIIDTLKSEIARAGYPVKPVLQSLLGSMYYNYYKQNRWNFNQRTHLEKPSDDITHWDLRTIITETDKQFRASLANASAEQQTPIARLDLVLRGDAGTRYLRPTLYDLLLHRALEFYLDNEPELIKPKESFSLNDTRFFADARTFGNLAVQTADTASVHYRGIKLLQQASLYHLSKNEPEAAADLDIMRLEFLHRNSTIDVVGKDSLYLNALRRIAADFEGKPIVTDALFNIGKYYQGNEKPAQALVYFNKAVALFPKSLGGENSAMMIKAIMQKQLNVATEDVNMPGVPLLASAGYKNVKSVKYSIYRLSQDQKALFDQNWNQYNYGQSDKSAWLLNLMKQRQPVQEKQFDLPDLNDYRDHRAEFKIDPLEKGSYLLWVAATDASDMQLDCFAAFNVSALAYSLRNTPNQDVEMLVTDRKTGAPVKGVHITVEAGSKTMPNSTADESGLSNKNGKWVSKNVIVRGSVFAAISFNGDTLINRNRYFYSSYYRERNEDELRTVLFTDRQIYRPGQTIYFKGIQLRRNKNGTTLNSTDSAKIELLDVNRKNLKSLVFKPNEFGSFSGTFVLPQSMLTGQVALRSHDNTTYLRVEEYKRPTFKAELKTVTQSYHLADSITLKGSVTTFSGYGISQARVAYHVTRSEQNIPYRYNYVYTPPTEIKVDTIQTDTQGQFSIKISPARADLKNQDNNIIYVYQVTLDATDAAGETHSANTSFKVGNHNIAVQSYFPATVMVKDTAGIPMAITNLNNQKQKGTLSIQVYQLQKPARLFKNRLWPLPDVQLMTRAQHYQDFADYAYSGDNNMQNWPVLQKLADTVISASDKDPSFFYPKRHTMPVSQAYKVVILARNLQGDTASTTRYFTLTGDTPTAAKIENWVVPVKTTVAAGGKAQFSIGINEPLNVLMEKYCGSRIAESRWLHIDKSGQNIEIPLLPADSDVSVQFSTVYQNRLYNSYHNINRFVPDKKLDIKTVTFRDKLQPGDKDQWKLQITAPKDQKVAAEMVASLYDASLDDIASPVSWLDALADRPRYRSNNFTWNVYDFVREITTRTLINQPYYNYSIRERDYEGLNLGDYNYYGGYNQAFHNYTSGYYSHYNVERMNKEMEASFERQAAKVKEGVVITGKVIDVKGNVIPGVSITGAGISTVSNIAGSFKIKVPAKTVLRFNFIGYKAQQYLADKTENPTIKMQEDQAGLNEVVIVGYSAQAKKNSVTGAVSSVVLHETTIAPGKKFDDILAGKLAGLQITDGVSGGTTTVRLRGSSSLTAANRPLWIVDGVIVEGDVSEELNPDDIQNIDVLKDESAVAIYGARASNGVVIVSTKSGKAKLLGAQPVKVRKNFNETAFFYPQLHTDDQGQIIIDFTIPEALTTWKFRGFAHTADLKTGYIERSIITQKQLSITANTPRFLREGDTLTISARLANLTAAPLKGKVTLQLFNALTMQPVSILVNAADAVQNFETPPSANNAISFKIAVPFGVDALTYRLTAEAGLFSDGEENTLPVLPNRMLVTESLPMMVRAGQTRNFSMDKLVNQTSTTLKSKTLTFEYTQNPAWYAVQALPYMMEFPYECSEQIFSRYYANAMASGLIGKLPVIKKTFDEWKAANSGQLLSNLEKNQELKATLLEETPWLRDAMSETEQKKRIALLFDLDRMKGELQQTLDKLQKRQLPDGGFPWFGGTESDAYITRHILAGIGQLYHTGMADKNNKTLAKIAEDATDYTEDNLLEYYKRRVKENSYDGRNLSDNEIHGWYALSYFATRDKTADVKKYLADYLKLAEQQWLHQGLYEQGLIALTMLRDNKPEIAQKIIRSLNERAQQTDEMGMYWPANQLGYFWYQSPVETQCLMIELYTEAGGHDKEVEEMKIWLLRNKQTQNWKTTKATVAACYALLLKGADWLADSTSTSTITLAGQNLNNLKPNLKADAGTGYFKTSWSDEQVKPAMGKVSIANGGKTISWGAMYWQYLENLDKITPSNTDIHLERKYFILKQTGSGPVLTAIDATHPPKTGDVLKVVVYLKAGRDYEYVQLKDMRPSGTEPMDALSAYKYQDGLGYYQATKDAATNFFISRLPKGNYVFEYQLRVVQPGNFSTGITNVQCMYAPEFSAHSEGSRMVIK